MNVRRVWTLQTETETAANKQNYVSKEESDIWGIFNGQQINVAHRDTAEPLADFLLHETFEDGDGLLAQPDRVEHVVVEDRLEEIVLVVRLERGLTSHHLVHEDAKSPPGVGECGTHGVGNEETQRRTKYQIIKLKHEKWVQEI